MFPTQIHDLNTWNAAHIAGLIVIVAALCAIVWVAMSVYEVQPPPWVVKIFWIVVVCFVCLFAIKLIASMW